jgi:hypothetical protein
MLYNMAALNSWRTTLVVLAFLVAAFVALYPYLGSMGICDSGGCPQIVHSASGGFSTACPIAAVLVVVPFEAAPDLRFLVIEEPASAPTVRGIPIIRGVNRWKKAP